MSRNNADNRGTITQSGNIMRVENALVEKVSVTDRSANTGYLVFSYAVPMQNGMVSIELYRLNIGRNTVLLNSLGIPMCLCDIRPGMWIDAVFSSAATRSIPPQSNALFIMTRRGTQPAMSVTTDRVIMVDPVNHFLYTGNPQNINRQMRFVITDQTLILGRNGAPVSLRSIRPGQMVRISHANFQTASIPPQTTAFLVQLL